MARLNNLTERGLETQQNLSDALFQLIAEKDYGKITISDITNRAQIDRTTFYLHFSDKDDLFLKSQQKMIEELLQSSQNSAEPYPVATSVFRHIAQNLKTYQALFTLNNNSFFAKQLKGFLLEIISPLINTIKENHPPDHQKIDFLVNYVIGAFRGIAIWWIEEDMPIPAEEMAKLFVQMSNQGIEALLHSTSSENK